ncbi:MAG TPA: DegT/DnrJ/EryC1/StrS family aminotransferase [Terriglobia bacterium]|nr:DegT/DnrJ/EryC1/StrS family aminotransferase [Terriglobia bacterium]
MCSAFNVPFLDLTGLHAEIEEDLVAVLKRALRTSEFVGGPEVEEFECEFARFCDVDYCVGVSSGTDALRFALMAAGVAPGDVVITVPNTFIATVEAISQAGALPHFIDIDSNTYNLDVQKLRNYLENECIPDGRRGRLTDKGTGRDVTAIVPVHLYGQPADMDAILELARLHDLVVIEDACQAHGAEYFSQKEDRWKKAGSMGTAAAFSFYPGKNLGACGEAGAVTTNNPDLARKVRMLRDHGQAKKYYHEMEGYNGRLDAIQAGILRIKLKRLSDWNEKRREAADCYRELFRATGQIVILPDEPEWTRPIYHLFVVRVAHRDEFLKFLTAAGIGIGIHYPIPLHLQKAYRHLGYRCGDFPVTEKVSSEILSLPMYPGLTRDQQTNVVEVLRQAAIGLAKNKRQEVAQLQPAT